MKQPEQWISELTRRQQNVLPLDTIRNGALFEEGLIRGSKLKPWQRLAGAFYGIFVSIGSSVLIGFAVIPSLRHGDFTVLALLGIALLGVYAGVLKTVNSIFPAVDETSSDNAQPK